MAFLLVLIGWLGLLGGTGVAVEADRVGSRVVATMETPGVAKCVTVEGRYAYVGYRGGMLVYDVSEPTEPDLVETLELGKHYVNEIRIVGDRAYLAAGFGGILVIDLSDPGDLKPVGGFSELGEVLGVDVHGSVVYASGNSVGLGTLQYDDGKMTFVGQRRLAVGGQFVQRVGDSVYVSDRRAGLAIFEASANDHAKDVSLTKTADEAFGFQIVGNIAYICDQDTGFTTIDVSSARWPKYLATVRLPGFAYKVDVEGTRAYVASTEAGIHVIDVYDPASPRVIDAVGGMEWAFDIDVVGRFGYVADGRGGFKVIEFARD